MRRPAIAVREVLAVAEDAARPGAGFAARSAALDVLEVHVLNPLAALERPSDAPGLQELGARAGIVRDRLARANERVLRRLRERIRRGRYTHAGLRRSFERLSETREHAAGYGTLDLLVAGLLTTTPPGEERAPLEPEMVRYQPTPARAILALIQRADVAPVDVLYHLGSGLGHVVLLVALLTGARTCGIELEPAYVEYAARSARELRVSGVELVVGDAREAPLAGGTLYFLYTPFRGAMLQQVLDRLRAESLRRPIRVCTYGPCTAEVAAASWLRPARPGPLAEDEVAVFHGG